MASKRIPTLLPLLSRPPIRLIALRIRPPHAQPPPQLLRARASLLTFPSHRLYSSDPPALKHYTFDEINTLATSPNKSSSTLIIDVREPDELSSTGRIPGAVSMPFWSNQEGIYLSAEDFYDRFGFEKPGEEGEADGKGAVESEEAEVATAGHGGADPSADLGVGAYGGGDAGVKKEVIFYCKAGVRSRAAAQMAAGEGGWKGVRVGEMSGGMDEWVGRGGKVER